MYLLLIIAYTIYVVFLFSSSLLFSFSHEEETHASGNAFWFLSEKFERLIKLTYLSRATGYYRVNYDSTNWQRIAAYLNSDNHTKIHILNRAQIIDDVYHFLMEKQLDFSTFVNITSYLQHESEQMPWFSMFQILPKLWRAFLLPIKESATLQVDLTLETSDVKYKFYVNCWHLLSNLYCVI